MSGLLYVPIAALALLARGTALAAQRRLALGPHSGAIPHSFTTDSPVTVHQLGFMFDDCNNFFKRKADGRDPGAAPRHMSKGIGSALLVSAIFGGGAQYLHRPVVVLS